MCVHLTCVYLCTKKYHYRILLSYTFSVFRVGPKSEFITVRRQYSTCTRVAYSTYKALAIYSTTTIVSGTTSTSASASIAGARVDKDRGVIVYYSKLI